MSNALRIKKKKNSKYADYARLVCPDCSNEYFLEMEKLTALRARQRRFGPQRIKCLKCGSVRPVKVEADRVLFFKKDTESQTEEKYGPSPSNED